MAEQEYNHSNDFIKESVKQRPLDRKKLLRKTLTTAMMAVVFGTIACITFLVLEPLISKKISQEEKPQVVYFREETDEMLPEEMVGEKNNSQSEAQSGEGAVAFPGIAMDKDGYGTMYASLADFVQELKKYMVTVTGISSEINWLSNTEESRNQVSGMMLLDNGVELLVLTDASVLEGAETILLTFYDASQAEASVKGVDPQTDMAVLAVPLADLTLELRENLYYPVLGSSNNPKMLGMPLIALGNASGVQDSIGYGMITSASLMYSMPERNVKLIQTDIHGCEDPNGILFDLEGRVIGVLTDQKTPNKETVLTAYGITELKRVLEKLSNGNKISFLGISGISVTKEANVYNEVPLGAFISDVVMDSPAMRAGVQKGDIISEVNGRNITTFTDYTNMMMSLNPGDEVVMIVLRKNQGGYKEITFTMQAGEVK
ncbi:MAG: S1C family serine protease [Acetatifactor sp.]|nr:S1C family serine protease [Acetatifactor sp.]